MDRLPKANIELEVARARYQVVTQNVQFVK